MADRPELDETGGMKDRPSHPHDRQVTDREPDRSEQRPDPKFETPKDDKTDNDKQRSGNR